ncbi:MAG: hypothetical protein ACOYJO_06695 [Eubacterium sp.]|jgi:hypothetical protein
MSFFSKRMDRAFEIMKARNEEYLKEMAEKEGKDEDDGRIVTDVDSSELHVPEDFEDDVPEIEDELSEAEKKAKAFHEDDSSYEKGDLPAIMIAAILTFGPIFLILAAIIILAVVFIK